jgi:hypothetical protein
MYLRNKKKQKQVVQLVHHDFRCPPSSGGIADA